MIERECTQKVVNLLAQFPAVVLLGPRQVGKTTLAKEIAKSRDSLYLDLERPSDRNKLSDADQFLEVHQNKLVILDEVHRTPELFQSLRGLIDRGRNRGYKTGRFLLLGSASIELLKQSGESLAGRVVYVDLPPFDVLEVKQTQHEDLWLRGGFPDSFLAQTNEQSMIWRENFIWTYLERDIPLLGPRIQAESLYRFWVMLAHAQGSILNAAKLAQSLAVNNKTIARYLDLMVGLMLIRRLQPYHVNIKKRLVKSPKIYVRDSGILHALLNIHNRNALFGHAVIGSSWEGFVIENLINSSKSRILPSYYRTSAGAEIDLILEFPGLSQKWAIEVKFGSTPKISKGFHIALEDVQPDRTFVVHSGESRYPLSEGVEAIGLPEMLKLVRR
ncbi:MAG: ATP-binding protein [Gammaproteobacteria bacterium]|nr:ATP-binding protein [Gammaproteobacteria bacterium]MCY4218000.1 ATP-binding protein [Gammaproteobacteria bacterium]